MKITSNNLTVKDKAILAATVSCIIISIAIVATATFTGYVPSDVAYNLLLTDVGGIALLLGCLGYQAHRGLKLSTN